MALIYLSDLAPIMISWIVFSMLAVAHRVLLPAKYSAFLQFKEEEDAKKTIRSTSIRIIYLVMGTCFLNLFLEFTEKQIGIGVFMACFLNIWPAIIQNQLLKLRKNRTEWLILIGYLLFVVTSVLVEIMTIRLFIPLLKGDTTVYWLDNQAITIIFFFIVMAFPITAESVLSKFTRIVVVQTIDTFVEEVYILEHQLNMESTKIEKNKYLIDKMARENDINVILLETILRLEIFYRGRVYNKFLEKCLCKYFSKIAIKKNVSVGLAQIRISTAGDVLKENPYHFIKEICDDNLNIEVCAKLLKILINKYEDMCSKNSNSCEDYEDVYDYIACEYIGAYAWEKEKTALIYSAVLRSFMKEKKLYYMGSQQTGRCLVHVYKADVRGNLYDKFQELLEKLGENVIIKEKVFVQGQELMLKFICDDENYIGLANDFAKEYKFGFEVIEI